MTLGGFGFEAFNKNGIKIAEVLPEDNTYAPESQLSVLKLNPGETGELILKLNSKDIPASIKLMSDVKFISSGPISLNGAIGKYGTKNFDITFNFGKGSVDGQYQYNTSPKGAYLYVTGSTTQPNKEPGNITFKININENTSSGKASGNFDGTLRLTRDSESRPYYYVMTGTFDNYKAQQFPFTYTSQPIN